MKLRIYLTVLATLAIFSTERGFAEGNQVFYRYGVATLNQDRGNQVFTDTNGAAGTNDKTTGWNIGAGLDIAMMNGLGSGDLLGEILVEYAHYSQKEVRQTTSALLSGTDNSKVTVSGLTVAVAPKYRFNQFMEGKLRPWVIPVGLAFLVNSPPSNNSAYLDIGYHLGAGVEYLLMKELSLGVDYRYTLAAKESGVDMTNSTANVYVGVNF